MAILKAIGNFNPDDLNDFDRLASMTSTSSAAVATGVNLDIAITGASEGTGDNTATATKGYPSASFANPLTEYYIIKLILNLLYSSSQAWRA